MHTLPQQVTVVEVGPRDGLQNESSPVAVDTRISLVNRLGEAGLPVIETGSFVSPRWVPQMADSEAVFNGIQRLPGVRYTALTPNIRGLERALEARASEVAVFAAASEEFSRRNTNCSIDEALERFSEVCRKALELDLPVRGYVSCSLGCPYQGNVPVADVIRVTRELLAMGCYQVSLGDTIGVGTAGQVQELLWGCLEHARPGRLAVHFHDTYGQALANILAALQTGIHTVDSSVAGLGGCPYAKGASGNVATEDVVYMLQGMGIDTGVDMPALLQTSWWISEQLQRENHSRVACAVAAAGR